MSGETAIEVHGLTKHYGGRAVVDDVSLTVRKGEIAGFLGPNGSGKTTTIRLMCGLLTPDDGEGRVLGHDIRRAGRAIKREVGYMTQRFSFYEDLTIEENLNFVAGLYGLSPTRRRVADTLADLGLTARRHQLAGSLSGGWKQRLALAACIMHAPKLLMLDEPTAGVDPKARREFWDEIHELAANGLTVLVSTHYMDEAERCHALAILDQGALVAAGTPADLARDIDAQVLLLRSPRPRAVSKYLFPEHADEGQVPTSNAAPFVHSTAQIGNTLRVMVEADLDRPEQRLRQVLSSAGLPVDECRRVEPSLEDVFVAATQARKRTRAKP